jgi:hypothetical protein
LGIVTLAAIQTVLPELSGDQAAHVNLCLPQ